MQKEIYYYIDETGSINGNSKSFILSCCVTDEPNILKEKIKFLRKEIENDIYFKSIDKKFKEQGFHACENHFDIRAKFYGLLPLLNFRAYILVLRKETNYFKSLKGENLTDVEIYDRCIQKLLYDRLLKNRNHNNILIFEQFGNKNQKREKEIELIINNIKNEIYKNHELKIIYNLQIKDKSEILLSITDYINYIIHRLVEKEPPERMLQNFQLVEPKIGLLYLMDSDIFYSRKNKINIDDIRCSK